MKRKSMYKAISKGLLTFGIIGSLSLSSGITYAAGNVAVVSNATVVKAGEELGISVVLDGDGSYDVYIGITGGIFENDFIAFDANSELVTWQPPTLPAKLRNNINIANLSAKDKIIELFPRISLDEYAGNYSVYAVLTKPGKFDLGDPATVIDGPLNIEIQKESE